MDATWADDGTPIRVDTLRAEGVLYETLPLDPAERDARLDALMRERGYVKRDVVELRPETPNLEAICAKFLPEHRHTEDEVRFALEGEGVFEIRSRDDRFMKVKLEPGDLIVVPAERNHRFYLTDVRTIRCVRLFQTEDGWVAHYRSKV